MKINIDINKPIPKNEIESSDWRDVIKLVMLLYVAQEQILYGNFKKSILNKNRFITTDEEQEFFDKIKEYIPLGITKIKKGKLLYRARTTDEKFNTSFAKSLLETVVDKEIEEDINECNIFEIDGFFETLAIIDPDNFLGMQERIAGWIEKFNSSRFRGYNEKESGAPPSHLAGEGRLNPKGISYLYTAEDEKTAIHEVKPYIGQTVSVATLKAKKGLRVFDLTKDFPANVQDFFGFERTLKSLIQIVIDEFQKPNCGDPMDYIPTQYFTEYIKEIEQFDGIKFWSSVKSGGKNIVLFDTECCDVVSSKLVGIKSIDITFSPLQFPEKRQHI